MIQVLKGTITDAFPLSNTGRNISWLEIQKVIPEILRMFEIELADPGREWKVVNHWFCQQEGLICQLKRRHASS